MEDGKRRKDDWGLEEKKPRVVGQKPAASLQGLAANHKAGMIHQSSCPVCLRSPLMTAPPETKAVAALRGRLGLRCQKRRNKMVILSQLGTASRLLYFGFPSFDEQLFCYPPGLVPEDELPIQFVGG